MIALPVVFEVAQMKSLLAGAAEFRFPMQEQPELIPRGAGAVGLRVGKKLIRMEDVAHLCHIGQPGAIRIPAVPMRGYEERYCVDVAGVPWSMGAKGWRRLVQGAEGLDCAFITPCRDGVASNIRVDQLVAGAYPAGLPRCPPLEIAAVRAEIEQDPGDARPEWEWVIQFKQQGEK